MLCICVVCIHFVMCNLILILNFGCIIWNVRCSYEYMYLYLTLFYGYIYTYIEIFIIIFIWLQPKFHSFISLADIQTTCTKQRNAGCIVPHAHIVLDDIILLYVCNLCWYIEICVFWQAMMKMTMTE